MGALHDIGSLLSGLAAIAALAAAAVGLRVSLAQSRIETKIETLRTEMTDARRRDRLAVEDWVERRFVRIPQKLHLES